KIAGLSVTKSRKIIEWRQKNGVFINREQLLSVKGLGPKSYEQCAGFVRINPETIGLQQGSSVVCEKTNHDMKAGIKRKTTSTKESKSKKRKVDTTSVVNVLDMTWIHPESYDIAERLLSKVDASVNEIGQSVMTTKLDQTIHQYGMEVLADELKVGIPTLTLIIDGLKQPKDFDIRSGFAKPLFRKGVMSINDLRSGDVLTGRVENATHFGAFVDIGVGQNGLIHTSQMPHYVLQNGTPLGPGDKVKVKVMNVDVNRGRIGLQLLEVVN
ncbi:S1 RNA-binding domain-containing protein 1-like, partial [Saccoglossus kowalevskii]|uniref:S1 RNA-binding domain-containing protein 1-like n=1 Tax=Saccoglossus kowalevskii TaxID=10224 RepID=A0ABM0GKR0_SACKO